MINNKVDINALGIDTKLARKYNAIVNFIKKNTTYEDGCLNYLITEIDYVRETHSRYSYVTTDYIKMVVGEYTIWISNHKALKIDRKFNSIVKVADLIEI